MIKVINMNERLRPLILLSTERRKTVNLQFLTQLKRGEVADLRHTIGNIVPWIVNERADGNTIE